MSSPQFPHELLKAEYDRIKSEQSQRIGFRDNMLFVHLAAVGAVGSWVLMSLNPAPPAQPSPYAVYALLVIPWIGIVLGWSYVVNDHLISRIGTYVRTILAPRAAEWAVLKAINVTEEDGRKHTIVDVFGWEPFHRTDRRRVSRKIMQCLVDLATFVLPSVLALLGFVYLRGWHPGTKFGGWRLDDWLTMVVLVVESLFLVVLAYSIIAYADFIRGIPASERAQVSPAAVASRPPT